MNLQRLGQIRVRFEPLVYAILAFASSWLLKQILNGQGATTFNITAIPLLCGAVLLSRWRVLEALIPPTVLIGIGSLGLVGRGVEAPSQQALLAGTTLVLFASITRYQAWFTSTEKLGTTTRLNYTPTADVPLTNDLPGPGMAATVGLLFMAWILAGTLCGKLLELSSDYKLAMEYKYQIQRTIGLDVPEVYLGMKLLFTLAVIFWVTRNALDYYCFRRDGSEVAALHLRSELWRWNGREQRLISKQSRKNTKVAT